MSRSIIIVMLLVAMSFSGIAKAADVVFIEGVGEVSASTAKIIFACRAINEANAKNSPPKKEILVSSKEEKKNTATVKVAKTSTAVGIMPQGITTGQSTVRPTVRPLTDIREADHEVYAYVGGTYSFDSKTKGGWLSAKNTKWWGLKHYPFNLGGGLSLDSSIGKTGAGYTWGYAEPGVNLGLYAFDEDNNNDALLRLNLAYRLSMSKNNKEGFVPGIELQVAHAFSNRLSLIAQVQAKYFPNDSHGGAGLFLEYLVTPEFRLKGGIVADLGLGDNGYSMFGVGPNASVEIDNRYVLGMNLLFFPSPNGITIGPYVGLKYTKYLEDFDKQKRGDGVVKISNGEVSKPLPEASDIYMRDNGNGSQSTLSWDSQDDQKDITLAQSLKQVGGEKK